MTLESPLNMGLAGTRPRAQAAFLVHLPSPVQPGPALYDLLTSPCC